MEKLEAEQRRVTALSVREEARVQMKVAAQAAAEFNALKSAETAIPPVPETLGVRLAGIWREAYCAARGEFDAERRGWKADLDEMTSRIEALQAAIIVAEEEKERVETLRNASDAQARALSEQLHTAEGELRDARTELEKTGIRIQDLTAARDQLQAELTEERARSTEAQTRSHEQITAAHIARARTEATLEATASERDRIREDLTNLQGRMSDREHELARTKTALRNVASERGQLQERLRVAQGSTDGGVAEVEDQERLHAENAALRKKLQEATKVMIELNRRVHTAQRMRHGEPRIEVIEALVAQLQEALAPLSEYLPQNVPPFPDSSQNPSLTPRGAMKKAPASRHT